MIKPIKDCLHKQQYSNKKSYTNHRRWCVGDMSSFIKKRRAMVGIKAPCWKGVVASYKSKHEWVRKWLPRPSLCKCGNLTKEVSNYDKQYTRNLNDWEWLCISCHRRRDADRRRILRGEQPKWL